MPWKYYRVPSRSVGKRKRWFFSKTDTTTKSRILNFVPINVDPQHPPLTKKSKLLSFRMSQPFTSNLVLFVNQKLLVWLALYTWYHHKLYEVTLLHIFPCCSLWFCATQVVRITVNCLYRTPDPLEMFINGHECEWYFTGCLSLPTNGTLAHILVAVTCISNVWVPYFGAYLGHKFGGHIIALPTKNYLLGQLLSFWESILGLIKIIERIKQLSRASHTPSFSPQHPTHQQKCA